MIGRSSAEGPRRADEVSPFDVDAVLDWREKEARNETVFREMNEWTVDDRDSGEGTDRGAAETYLCECSDSRCTDPINLTRPEYEAVRAEALHFAIALNHENPEIDTVISENERYAVVGKYDTSGARIARETDPRR